MLARTVAFVLSAISVATAWPIFFYEGDKCDHYPVLTIEGPVPPNTCFNFGRVDVQSYSGSTRDDVQKILLYNDLPTCIHDEAHRAYANYTITNSTTTCHSFGNDFKNVPRSYVFIEEVLGPIPKVASTKDACSPLVVQN